MIVSCTNCKSQYSVNDSKIKGKIFGFNCPKCGTNVEIDNREKRKDEREESFEQVVDKVEKKGVTSKIVEESGTESGAAFSEEEGLIGDDGLIGDIMGSSEDAEVDFGEETEPSGIVKKRGILDIEQEPELPSEDDLAGALKNLSSGAEDEESSLNIDDMDLPDLESLGDISDAGETAEDAIISSAGKDTRDDEMLSGIEEDSKTRFDDNFLDELGDDDTTLSGGKESALDEEFSPLEIEEEITTGNDLAEESSFGKELSPEETEEMDTDSLFMHDVKSDEIFTQKKSPEDEDENITIDLDSLDIQLEEEFENKAGESRETEELSESFEPLKEESLDISDFEGDIEELKEIKEKSNQQKVIPKKITEDEEDITIDLDALDLTLDEVEELKEGEAVDLDDERITLSDAGLTPEELVKEKETEKITRPEDEDIRLTIDEVAPEVGKLPEKKTDELSLIEEELPEIDLEEFEDDDVFKKDEKDIEPDDIQSRSDFKEHESEIASPDADIRDTVPGGMINFSIDYSLKYSRTGAIFRLLCLYPIILIPHFIVFLLYSVLSAILSFFNWLIIAFSGTHEEDFTWIQENTIRYLLSLSACGIDVIEEMPEFAGRKDIDYSLQYDATYPISYSRIMAILRISVIGIVITSLPHLIILAVLSIGCAVIYLIGIFSIIIRKKWPKVLFDFMVRYYRYCANILSFITGVIDRYPSFKFE